MFVHFTTLCMKGLIIEIRQVPKTDEQVPKTDKQVPKTLLVYYTRKTSCQLLFACLKSQWKHLKKCVTCSKLTIKALGRGH